MSLVVWGMTISQLKETLSSVNLEKQNIIDVSENEILKELE